MTVFIVIDTLSFRKRLDESIKTNRVGSRLEWEGLQLEGGNRNIGSRISRAGIRQNSVKLGLFARQT